MERVRHAELARQALPASAAANPQHPLHTQTHHVKTQAHARTVNRGLQTAPSQPWGGVPTHSAHQRFLHTNHGMRYQFNKGRGPSHGLRHVAGGRARPAAEQQQGHGPPLPLLRHTSQQARLRNSQHTRQLSRSFGVRPHMHPRGHLQPKMLLLPLLPLLGPCSSRGAPGVNNTQPTDHVW